MTKRRGAVLSIVIMLVWTIIACSEASKPVQADDYVHRVTTKYTELASQPYTVTKVKRVVDGDTFETSEGDKVRLIGVNTPESIGKVEYFGKEASKYSKDQLTGKTVYLFKDSGNTDKYGRLLRYVFVSGNELMYNELLVREGYANPMTVPPNVMYAKLFVEAERDARGKSKGLWAEGDADKAKTDSSVGKCEDPTIKGNINSKGDKIYHVPGGRSYEQTIPEALFCTEQEAVDAGFRKAAN